MLLTEAASRQTGLHSLVSNIFMYTNIRHKGSAIESSIDKSALTLLTREVARRRRTH